MSGENRDQTPRVENMEHYEREKIERTLTGARHLVAVIENYLKTVDYCDEHGVALPNRKKLEAIRRPGELADPMGSLTELAVVFESGMNDMSKNINVSHKGELEKRYSK